MHVRGNLCNPHTATQYGCMGGPHIVVVNGFVNLVVLKPDAQR